MLEHPLSRYRLLASLDAGAVFHAHGLTVNEETRDSIANLVMECRLANERKQAEDGQSVKSETVLQYARKAHKHALVLLRFSEKPPSRKESVQRHTDGLREVLAKSEGLALEIGLRQLNGGGQLDLVQFQDSLEAGRIDLENLGSLKVLLGEVIQQSVGAQRGGRPWGGLRPIVRAGVIAWWRAGEVRSAWQWDEAEGRLNGRLPDFLRALLACCGRTMTDAALKSVIVSDAKPLQNYVDSRT